jgi:hypothetical protein
MVHDHSNKKADVNTITRLVFRQALSNIIIWFPHTEILIFTHYEGYQCT